MKMDSQIVDIPPNVVVKVGLDQSLDVFARAPIDDRQQALFVGFLEDIHAPFLAKLEHRLKRAVAHLEVEPAPADATLQEEARLKRLAYAEHRLDAHMASADYAALAGTVRRFGYVDQASGWMDMCVPVYSRMGFSKVEMGLMKQSLDRAKAAFLPSVEKAMVQVFGADTILGRTANDLHAMGRRATLAQAYARVKGVALHGACEPWPREAR